MSFLLIHISCYDNRYELVLRHTEAHMVSAGRKYPGPSMIALASELLQIKITCLMNCIYCHIRKNQWPQGLNLCERIMDDSVARDRMSPIEMLRLMYFKCFAMINSILNSAADDPERVQRVADVKDAVQEMLRLLVNSHARHENNFKGASNDLREILELNKLLENNTSSVGTHANLVSGDTTVPGTMQPQSSVQNTAVAFAGVDIEIAAYNANSETGVRTIGHHHDIQQVTILGKQLEASEKKLTELMLKHRKAVAFIQEEKDKSSKQLSMVSAQLNMSESQCAELLHQLEDIRAENNENKRLLLMLSSKLGDKGTSRVELLQLIQQNQGHGFAQSSASNSGDNDEFIRTASSSTLAEAMSLIMLRIPMDFSAKRTSSDMPQIAGAGTDLDTTPSEGGSATTECVSIMPAADDDTGSYNTQNGAATADGSCGIYSCEQYDDGANSVSFQEPSYSVAETTIKTRASNEIVDCEGVEEPNKARPAGVESHLLLHRLPEYPILLREQNFEVVH